MQPNIGRWPRNTIALPVCAGRLNPANSTCAGNKNSGRLRSARNACTGRVPRSMRAIRRSLNSAGRVQHTLRCSARNFIASLACKNVAAKTAVWRIPPCGSPPLPNWHAYLRHPHLKLSDSGHAAGSNTSCARDRNARASAADNPIRKRVFKAMSRLQVELFQPRLP